MIIKVSLVLVVSSTNSQCETAGGIGYVDNSVGLFQLKSETLSDKDCYVSQIYHPHTHFFLGLDCTDNGHA